MVLDLSVAATSGLFEGVGENPSEFWVKVFSAPALNDFMALGKPAWQAVRAQLNNLLTGAETSSLVESALVPIETVAMLLPAKVTTVVCRYTCVKPRREHDRKATRRTRPHTRAHTRHNAHAQCSRTMLTPPILSPTNRVPDW